MAQGEAMSRRAFPSFKQLAAELYKEWMDALLTHMEWDDHATSRLFEWSWRRIFHAANMTLNEARLYHRVGAMIHSSRARN